MNYSNMPKLWNCIFPPTHTFEMFCSLRLQQYVVREVSKFWKSDLSRSDLLHVLSFIESRTLCFLPINTDGAFGQIPSRRTGYYAKRSEASSMLIKKLIFFFLGVPSKILVELYIQVTCVGLKELFFTHI